MVHAYLEYNGEHQRLETRNLRNSLAEQLKKYKNEINEKRNELRKIVEKGKVTVTRPISPKSSKNSTTTRKPTYVLARNRATDWPGRRPKTSSRSSRSKSELKTLEDAKQMSEDDTKQLSMVADKDREAKIQSEFQKDPEVMALCEDIAKADEQRAHAKAIARKGNDPARQFAEQKYKKLRMEYDELWKVKYEEIGERLKNANADPQQTESAIFALKRRRDSLKAEGAELAKLYAKLIVEKKESTKTALRPAL